MITQKFFYFLACIEVLPINMPPLDVISQYEKERKNPVEDQLHKLATILNFHFSLLIRAQNLHMRKSEAWLRNPLGIMGAQSRSLKYE